MTEDELALLRQWLGASYDRSVRTAYLIVGNRDDAEDAVQEAFIRAWRFRAALSTKSNFDPWLYRIVVNSCNSMLRREIPIQRAREDEDRLEQHIAPRDRIDEVALNSDVARAIAELPLHLRVVVVLKYYAELSEREIAVAISRQPGTVKSRLSEARSRLARHPALSLESSELTTREGQA